MHTTASKEGIFHVVQETYFAYFSTSQITESCGK